MWRPGGGRTFIGSLASVVLRDDVRTGAREPKGVEDPPAEFWVSRREDSRTEPKPEPILRAMDPFERTKSYRRRFPTGLLSGSFQMNNPHGFDHRVLVVDDDPAIVEMFRILLAREGISVDVVTDGDTALQSLRGGDYDAILLDLMLPHTNGFEVIRDLKCLQPDVLNRVIVVTAASQRTLECLDTHDVRTVLRKPFDIGELIAEVRACMAQRSGAHGTA